MSEETMNSEELQPVDWTREKIYSEAEKQATKLKYKPGGDLEDIVESLGGRIVYQNEDDWFREKSGRLEIRGVDDFTIYLPNFTPPLRDRFTIAHELGHYLMHYKGKQEKGYKVVYREGRGKLETEANYFAAGFLMPEKVFLEYDKKYKEDEYRDAILAGLFLLSKDAIRVRRKCLS